MLRLIMCSSFENNSLKNDSYTKIVSCQRSKRYKNHNHITYFI
jgi:hypothetical protein